METVYITGHRNPDTDSICSAICDANLKHNLTGGNFEPRRAGNVNPETQFVLDYFQVEAPRLIENVRTQVKDIEIRKTEGVDRSISLKNAWNLMRKDKIVTLPCISKDGTLEGLISIGDITKSYMNLYDSSIISKANTLVKEVAEEIDKLYFHNATRKINNFILEDLSRWYVRLIRGRTWVESDDPDCTNDKIGGSITLSMGFSVLGIV